MPPPTKTTSIEMKTASFCPLDGPVVVRTTIVIVRGRRGSAAMGIVAFTFPSLGGPDGRNGPGVNG